VTSGPILLTDSTPATLGPWIDVIDAPGDSLAEGGGRNEGEPRSDGVQARGKTLERCDEQSRQC
jgi:hypothetical protein